MSGVSGAILAELHSLAGLHRADREHLAAIATMVSAAPGVSLAREGDEADAIWVVVSGSVAIQTHRPGRGSVVVSTSGRGDLVGWSWMVPPRRWHFDVVAREASTLVQLPAAGVLALIDDDPAFGVRFLGSVITTLAGRLEGARLALLDLYDRPGSGGGR